VTEQQSFQNNLKNTVIIEDISNNLFSNTSTSTKLNNYSTVRLPSPLEVGHKKYGNYKPMEWTIELS